MSRPGGVQVQGETARIQGAGHRERRAETREAPQRNLRSSGGSFVRRMGFELASASSPQNEGSFPRPIGT